MSFIAALDLIYRFFFPYTFLGHSFIPKTSHLRVLLSLVGVIGSLVMLTAFTCVKLMPVSDAITLIFTTPLFTLILSAIFMRERLTLFKVVCGKYKLFKWWQTNELNFIISQNIGIRNKIIYRVPNKPDLIPALVLMSGIVLVSRPSFLFSMTKVEGCVESPFNIAPTSDWNEKNETGILQKLILLSRTKWRFLTVFKIYHLCLGWISFLDMLNTFLDDNATDSYLIGAGIAISCAVLGAFSIILTAKVDWSSSYFHDKIHPAYDISLIKYYLINIFLQMWAVRIWSRDNNSVIICWYLWIHCFRNHSAFWWFRSFFLIKHRRYFFNWMGLSYRNIDFRWQ